MARSFTGTNVIIGSAVTYTEAFTALAWIRAPVGATLPRILAMNTTEHIDVHVKNSDKTLSLIRDFTGGPAEWNVPGLPISLTQWTHIAWTHDGTTAPPRCYINGVPVNVVTVTAPTGTPDVATGAPYIGNRADTARPFGGQIAHVALYTRPLDLAAIREHMRGRPLGAGLLFYYPLEGGTPEPDRGPQSGSGAVTGATLGRGPVFTFSPSPSLLVDYSPIVFGAADLVAATTLAVDAVVTPVLAAASLTTSATLSVDAYTTGADLAWSGSGWNGRLQLAVFAGIGGQLLADWSSLAEKVTWSTNKHGFEALSATIPMSGNDALAWYAPQGLLHVEVNSDGRDIWEGRLEDPAIDNTGFSFTALGYYAALADDPVTAVWSVTSVEDWEQVTPADLAAYDTAQYEMDNTNRLYIAPRNQELFTSNRIGAWGYKSPHGGERLITSVAFDYRFNGFNDATRSWTFFVAGYNDGGAATIVWSLAGNNTTRTGTNQIVTMSGYQNILFAFRYDNAPEEIYTNTTGFRFLELVNVRVSTAATPITSSAIVRALAIRAATASPALLSGSDALIAESGIDLLDEGYLDEYPADILARLALLGDNQTPPRQWDVGVWEQRLLRFQPKGTNARTWYADVAEVNTQRTLENVTNSAYAVYEEAGGRELRGAIATDPISVRRYGVSRRVPVQAGTSSAAQATTTRDAVLKDGKDPIPRAGVVVTEIYDAAGCRWPLWEVRAGDVFVQRNLPPTTGGSVDQIRGWYIGRTEYDADNDQLTIEPEDSLPTASSLQARRSEGFGDAASGRASFTHVQTKSNWKARKKKKKKR